MAHLGPIGHNRGPLDVGIPQAVSALDLIWSAQASVHQLEWT